MSEPMYRLIADDLRRQIESGELAPGAQLPSEVELREKYGTGQDSKASRNTIRNAVKVLVSRGMVETRPGQGTFVMMKVVPFVSKLNTDPESGGIEDEVYRWNVKEQGRIPEETIPRVEVQASAGLVTRRLNLPEGAQVISRYQQRRIDGTAWSMQTTFYPMELRHPARRDSSCSWRRTSRRGWSRTWRRMGLKQVGWRDDDRGPAADPGTRERSSVCRTRYRWRSSSSGGPAATRTGSPIRFTVTVYPADQKPVPDGSRARPPADRITQDSRLPVPDACDDATHALARRRAPGRAADDPGNTLSRPARRD